MRKDLMQRVRIGLTGLSCVFLLVLLAAAFLGFTNDEADREMALAGGSPRPVVENSAQAADDQPKDPLAELGVAPGNAPEGPVENGSAPAVR